MAMWSNLTRRERLVMLGCALVVLAASIPTRLWPAWRTYYAEQSGRLAQQRAATDSLAAHVTADPQRVRTARLALDSLAALEDVVDALTSDAMRRLTRAADTLGVRVLSVRSVATASSERPECSGRLCTHVGTMAAQLNGAMLELLLLLREVQRGHAAWHLDEIRLATSTVGDPSSALLQLELRGTVRAVRLRQVP